MNKKRWALLLILAVLIFGYIKLFYKTYSVNAVVKNADCIVALDIKRITNTLLWNIITTPGQWKTISFSSRSKDEVGWKDMVKVPDYVLGFHVKDQPAGIWYLVLQVKNERDFEKGLQRYHFEKISAAIYTSKDLGISFSRNDNKVLITNASVGDSNYLSNVANELFIQKQYITKANLEKAIDAKSHLAICLFANNFLQQPAIITGNFDKTQIEIKAVLTPNKQFSFTENNFSYTASSLWSFGFTQPSKAVYDLLNDTNKANISKAINFNIDSFLLPSNKYYQLELTAIKPRVDSAISYSYDEDFNKVEKVVVNNLQEPAFNFLIHGDSVKNIYNYFINTNRIEETDSGKLFTPMPFVKSYFNIRNDDQLNITAANYLPNIADKKNTAVLFFSVLLSRIPKDLLNYLPDSITGPIGNIESIQLEVHKQNEQLNINAVIQKKKNDLPIIKL
jgi:hypothetical protein